MSLVMMSSIGRPELKPVESVTGVESQLVLLELELTELIRSFILKFVL